MPTEFIRVRVPSTGAHVSVPASALRHMPGLERLDRPATDTPAPGKTKKPKAKAAPAANETKE